MKTPVLESLFNKETWGPVTLLKREFDTSFKEHVFTEHLRQLLLHTQYRKQKQAYLI